MEETVKFRVVIAGSRGFSDYAMLARTCDGLLRIRPGFVVISGGARGADRLGERYAAERGLECVVMPADWDAHGKAAGPIRNEIMASQADALVAFWNGRSRGTRDMIRIAREYDLIVKVVTYGQSSALFDR